MKTFLSILFSACLILTACSDDGDDPVVDAGADVEIVEPDAGEAVPDMGDDSVVGPIVDLAVEDAAVKE